MNENNPRSIGWVTDARFDARYDGGTRSALQCASPTVGVTLTYDAGTSAVQPLLSRSISTTFTFARPATLFDLWIRAWHQPEDERPETLDAMLKHDEFKQILKAATRWMEKAVPDSRLLEELHQQIASKFTIRFLTRNLKYDDAGPGAFASWLREVLRSAAADIWYECQPDLHQPIRVVDNDWLAKVVAARRDSQIREDLLDVIGLVKKTKVRTTLLNVLDGMTATESAAEHGLSHSYGAELLQRGIAELRRLMCND